MRNLLCVALLFSVTAAPLAAGASTAKHVVRRHKIIHAQGIGVVVDQSKMIALTRPAKSIFVGNPTIADVTIIDGRHAFVLGKTFGVTNLIALDDEGREITNQLITVVNNHAAVTVNVAGTQYNYSCTSAHCEAAPRPGDVTEFVSRTESAITSHQDSAVKNATSAGSTQQVAGP